jgi:hypothetical protein
MATGTPSNSEHVFVPGTGTMTAVFTSSDQARSAISVLSDVGIGRDEVQVVAGPVTQAPDMESPAFQQDSPGLLGFDEIGHVVTETFSDDDKAYVEFDRVLAAGGALLSLRLNGHEPRRSEIASLLRARGASAVYYWGGLATERL